MSAQTPNPDSSTGQRALITVICQSSAVFVVLGLCAIWAASLRVGEGEFGKPISKQGSEPQRLTAHSERQGWQTVFLAPSVKSAEMANAALASANDIRANEHLAPIGDVVVLATTDAEVASATSAIDEANTVLASTGSQWRVVLLPAL